MATVYSGGLYMRAEYHKDMYNANLQPKGDLLPEAIFTGC